MRQATAGGGMPKYDFDTEVRGESTTNDTCKGGGGLGRGKIGLHNT